MSTGFQIQKRILREKVLEAVAEYEKEISLSIEAFNIPLLKAEATWEKGIKMAGSDETRENPSPK